MGRILIVDDGGESDVLLTALCEAYANMRISKESKDRVIIIGILGTFKEAKKMLNPWPISSRAGLIREMEKYAMDPEDLKKDNSRSMFLTDARSRRPSHNGRKKKVNRLRVRKRVKDRHRRG